MTDERGLRAITLEGVAYSVMLGVGETYFAAFALALGHGAVAAGLLATLPLLLGGVLQLLTPLAVRRLGSYRLWVVGCASAQALCFVPLVFGALRGSLGLGWVFAVATAYWAFGLATTPAWNAWVGDLVPPERRSSFFARRTRWSQLALLGSLALAGALLEWGGPWGPAFAGLFALAALARGVSTALLRRHPEPRGLVRSHALATPWSAWRQVRGGDAGRVLLYLLCAQVAVNVASPFFTPFMLGPLGLGYAGYTVLTGAAFVSRALLMPLLGRIAERRGTRLLLWLGAIGTVPLPALWLVSDSFGYLLGLQLFAGAAWGALELATLLGFFENLTPRERASVLAGFNFASTAAMALGTLVGARIFGWLGGDFEAYAALFVLSSFARLATVALVPRVPTALAETVAELRTLALRPSAGALQRPILALLGGRRRRSRRRAP